jgi:hypothetical protein
MDYENNRNMNNILNPLESGHRQFVEVKLSAYAGRKSL